MSPKPILPFFHFTASRRRRLHQFAAITVVAVAAMATGCSTSESPKESRSSKPALAHPTKVAPSSFAGFWSGHGNFLQINKDGSFKIGARVYVSCGEAPPPCDAMSNGTITDGYHASGRLTSVNGTVATGEVTYSNSPDWLPTGSLTMTLNPATNSISAAGINYCAPPDPDAVCGL
jgi:hypothetical protein